VQHRGERLAPLADRDETGHGWRWPCTAVLERYRVLQYQLHDRQGNAFTVKRRVRQADPRVPTYVRVPPEPLSRAWAHEIVPLSRAQLPAAPLDGSR
jgi:hypothetical protein